MRLLVFRKLAAMALGFVSCAITLRGACDFARSSLARSLPTQAT
jgi:hypothetical protein